MNLFEVEQLLDMVETKCADIKEEDKEFLNGISNMFTDTGAAIFTPEDVARMESIHRYLFAAGVTDGGNDHG